jgi:hypothetical protein
MGMGLSNPFLVQKVDLSPAKSVFILKGYVISPLPLLG